MMFCLPVVNGVIWFDIFIWHDHRSVCGKNKFKALWHKFHPAHEPKLKLSQPGNLKLKANHLKIEYGVIIETLPLIKNYSLIHIQMFFFLNSGWAASGWTSGGNLCSLSDWKTAASSKAVDTRRSDTPYLADCKPCGTVPLSSAASEQAFPLARWKGCKLHFMAANPVANGTVSRVHVVAGVLLAGASFVLLLPPPIFSSWGPFLDSRVTENCKTV